MAFPHSLPPALHPPRPAHRPPSALDQALLHRLVLRRRLPGLLVQFSNLVNQPPQTVQGRKSGRRMLQGSSIGEMASQKHPRCHQATSPRALLQNILSNLLGLCGTGRQRPSTLITKNLRYPWSTFPPSSLFGPSIPISSALLLYLQFPTITSSRRASDPCGRTKRTSGAVNGSYG